MFRFECFLSLALGPIAGCGGIAVIDADPGAGGGTTTTSTTTTPTGGTLDVVFESAFANANCQPVIPSDPLNVSADLSMTNAGASPVSAEIGFAQIDSASGNTVFAMTPTNVQVGAGETLAVELQKVPNSGSGTNGCSYCSATDLSFSVDIVIGLASQTVTGAVSSIGCTF
jgi:hypothetical protein